MSTEPERPLGPKPEWGYNFIGFVTANLGLAVAGRNTIARLLERGERIRALDLDPGQERHGADQTYASLVAPDDDTPYAVNLFHMNPIEIAGHRRDWWDWTDIRTSLNVCVPFWELPILPPTWTAILDGMDYVLAPSIFILETCQKCLPNTRLLYYPQSVELPPGIVADRARWSIPADAVAFLMTFDINSDPARKNPWQVLDAFSVAFPGNEPVRLMVRVNGGITSGIARRQMEALQARVDADHRIVLLNEPMDYMDMLSLYASSDVLVSLHRSEGLGLHLMEAMSLGTPVIATAYSGNMDFMDESSACLVPYALIPVEATQVHYAPHIIGEGQTWAQPDLEVAAQHMRKLAKEPAFRERMGQAAAAKMAEHHAMTRARDPFDTLREEGMTLLESQGPARAAVKRLTPKVYDAPVMRVIPFSEKVKRVIVLSLRKVRLYPPGP